MQALSISSVIPRFRILRARPGATYTVWYRNSATIAA
jgi:hypothetical protein